MMAYPWIEAWATGDKREHHLADRPRNAATRTALGVAGISFYVLLMIGGGNDVIAYNLSLSINSVIWFLRFAIFIVPPIVFVITKRMCLGLQRKDRDLLLHGHETGRLLRTPTGEFLEIHEPVAPEYRAKIEAREDAVPIPMPELADANGVANPGARLGRLQARASAFYFGDNLPTPTEAELAAAAHHIEDELADAIEAGSDAAVEIAGAHQNDH
jgi:ubiquinol-cytochrome c reductase cytochrome b subunit